MGRPYSRYFLRLFVLLLVALSLLSPSGTGGSQETPLRGDFVEGKPSAFINSPFEKELKPLDSNSPSLRHKILQLYRNEWTRSSQIPHPKKLVVDYRATAISLATYPVAAKFVKVFPVEPIGKVETAALELPITEDIFDGWIPLKSRAVPESDGDKVTYTPYIGMRAFTSILTFFHHLSDNFKSVHGLLRPETTTTDEEESSTFYL